MIVSTSYDWDDSSLVTSVRPRYTWKWQTRREANQWETEAERESGTWTEDKEPVVVQGVSYGNPEDSFAWKEILRKSQFGSKATCTLPRQLTYVDNSRRLAGWRARSVLLSPATEKENMKIRKTNLTQIKQDQPVLIWGSPHRRAWRPPVRNCRCRSLFLFGVSCALPPDSPILSQICLFGRPPAYFPSCQALHGKEPVEHSSPVTKIKVSMVGKIITEERKKEKDKHGGIKTQRTRHGITIGKTQSTRKTESRRKAQTTRMLRRIMDENTQHVWRIRK